MSQSPTKRTPSETKEKKKEDEAILDACIMANKLEFSHTMFFIVAAVTAFAPCYYSHAIGFLSGMQLSNLPLYVIVLLTTAYMLARAYATMFETEFFKRLRPYEEVKTEDDKRLLRQLRYETAMGWTVALTNGIFIIVSTLLQAYIFRKMDSRAGLLLSPTAAAACAWFVAQKNEESRRRRQGRN